MESSKPVYIRVAIDPLKLAKLIELMPDHEKGGGEKTKVIYWAINTAIAAKLKESNMVNQNIGNREYLRRI